MELLKYIKFTFAALILLGSQSCSDFLEEEVYSQLAPDNYLNTKEGIESVITDAYARAAMMRINNSIYAITPNEWTTDILYQSGDNVERTARDYINFTWDPSINFLPQNWEFPYQAIRDANLLLENLEMANISAQEKEDYTGELRFIRAISYYKLYSLFGPVPLRISTTQELQLERASDEAMQAFIETELIAATELLPTQAETMTGRAHKAAALAYLTRFYLNTKQWQKSADMAKRVMDEFNYSLFSNYTTLFRVENEDNDEYIWIRPAIATADRATANSWMNASFPANFAEEPISGLTYQNTWVNWPNEFRIYDDFYNTFEAGDTRRDLLITAYVNNSGETVSLLGADNIRSFKYWPDPNGKGASHGNDIPVVRYAEILLSRAEALNELNGPNAESIQLINAIRTRAGLTPITLGNFGSKEALRDHILQERGWEFYSEGHRRIDLIRMGKFISNAQGRGKTNAKPHHILFPLPQEAIDANPLLVQNEGY